MFDELYVMHFRTYKTTNSVANSQILGDILMHSSFFYHWLSSFQNLLENFSDKTEY